MASLALTASQCRVCSYLTPGSRLNARSPRVITWAYRSARSHGGANGQHAFDRNGLRFGVFEDSLLAVAAAETRSPSCRPSARRWRPRGSIAFVHVDRARSQLRGDTSAALRIRSPDAEVQPERAVVGHGDSFVRTVHGIQRHHRSECFVSVGGHAFFDAGQDGGLVEIPSASST